MLSRGYVAVEQSGQILNVFVGWRTEQVWLRNTLGLPLNSSTMTISPNIRKNSKSKHISPNNEILLLGPTVWKAPQKIWHDATHAPCSRFFLHLSVWAVTLFHNSTHDNLSDSSYQTKPPRDVTPTLAGFLALLSKCFRLQKNNPFLPLKVPDLQTYPPGLIED